MLRNLILIDRARRREESLQSLLRGEFDLRVFPDARKAIEEIRTLRPHGVIVIDDDEPGGALELLRRSEISKELPLIVVGPDSDPRREVDAFQHGADDYLTKDSEPEIFKARVLGILRQSFIVRRLESRLEEMDSFVRTVTHDLKNPIGSILSCSELLEMALESGEGADAKELSATIRKSSENALEFIEDLLSLLRNSARLQEVKEVPAREIIDAALLELSAKISARGAAIVVPEDLPPILCDRRRMVQVFANIIGNAIKYVPEGVVPRVTISSIETPHANTFVIGDNGIGMDPADTKKIFQAFTRLPDAARYEGTGLGLSIVQRIVESHEGDVFAVSRKGKGSEFYVVLPTKLNFVPQLEPQA